MFFKTQESMKTIYHSNVLNKKNMHFVVAMSNSHKKSWLSFAPKRALVLIKVTFTG